MAFHRTLAATLFVSIVSSTGVALAGDAQNTGTARELYDQGVTALDSGDAAKAVSRLTSAWSLVQTPVIGVALARAQQKLGHLVEAREAALAVVRLGVTANETSHSAQARAEAERIANALASRIPHVRIVLRNVPASSTPTVKLDGAEVPIAALTVPIQANPGAHVAAVEVEGRRAEGTVQLAEGQTADVVLDVPAPPPHANVVKPQENVATKPLEAPAEKKSSISPVVWVGVGLTGAGLALGAISGAFALSADSIVNAKCTTVSSVDGKRYCPPDAQGALSEANTTATVSTIGFIAAGVGVGVLVVGIVMSGSGKKAEHARVVPMLGPISGIAGVF